jgi:hypothetical protein
MVVDALWDAAGVRRAPSAIVDVDLQTLTDAASALDEGHGTVWVGDNREGWHGGADLLRWVRTLDQASAAHKFLAAHCDRVRVMPFLEGIPCSIHGWVFPTQTIALRPCEMLVFRIPASDKLSYAGAATIWEPPAPVCHEIGTTPSALENTCARRLGTAGPSPSTALSPEMDFSLPS